MKVIGNSKQNQEDSLIYGFKVIKITNYESHLRIYICGLKYQPLHLRRHWKTKTPKHY